jgi:hypothetical protein
MAGDVLQCLPISNILNGRVLRIAPERWPDWHPPTEILQRKPELEPIPKVVESDESFVNMEWPAPLSAIVV